MAIVAIFVLLIILGLTIQYWYIVLPIAAITAIVVWVRRKNDQEYLLGLTPTEKEAELDRRLQVATAKAQAAQNALEDRTERSSRVDSAISEVGQRTAAGLACPKCGGVQFQAKRSRGAKLLLVPTVGIGTFLAPKTRVKCVTCGTEYLRG